MKSERMRVLTAAWAALYGDELWKGNVGEEAARIWLEDQNMKPEPYNATQENMPETLRAMGGKRPDFKATMSGETVYLDAKYRKCRDDEFHMEVAEIEKYEKLRVWLLEDQGDAGERDVIFMVFPQKYHAKQFVFVHLDELINGTHCIENGNAAKKVSLADREDITFQVSSEKSL